MRLCAGSALAQVYFIVFVSVFMFIVYRTLFVIWLMLF